MFRELCSNLIGHVFDNIGVCITNAVQIKKKLKFKEILVKQKKRDIIYIIFFQIYLTYISEWE